MRSLLVSAALCVSFVAAAPVSLSFNATKFNFNESLALTTNVCNLEWYYCPRDPGCVTYANSVKNVVVHTDRSDAPVKSEDLKPGDVVTLVVSGVTSWKSVPIDATYLIYDGAGKNLAAGVLAGAYVLSGKNFVLTVPNLKLDAATASGTMFEFGLDIFSDKSHGDPEGMCLQIASPEHFKQESAKSGFELDCKDNGDGTWTPGKTPVVPHPLPAPSCAPKPPSGCKLNWFYCPRDPGCVTYTMSVKSVEVDVKDKTGIKAGDTVGLVVHGKTTLKAVPASGTYKIYDGDGKNAGEGILSHVMSLNAATGAFTLNIPGIVLDASSVQAGGVIEFGLDIFQSKSGSNEGMCIQVASDAYVAMVKPKASPLFDMYCEDKGNGVFVKKTVHTDPVFPAQCKLLG